MGRIQNKFLLLIIIVINLVFMGYIWIYELEKQKIIFKEYYLYSIENIIKNGSTKEAIAEKLDSELNDFKKNTFYFEGNNSFKFLNGNLIKIQYERDEIELSSLSTFAAECVDQKNCLRIFIKLNGSEAWKIEINNYLDLTYKFLFQLQVIGFLVINLVSFLVYIVVYKFRESHKI
ncbi:hypothetical protein [Leptospira sp. GIMC2001]|uniref:hypothetical protein n=1 Tax=Leptospira sp. GIMC2001 TaxID=1513297 RepID=UPI0023495C50|nr:hypothetical protein [Leptospira sp. GIMC2001]WCL50717.1 hypothetical protein O4O04_07875 [Leptospira sp. GIMC2001]